MTRGFDVGGWREANAVLRQLLELPANEREPHLAATSLDEGQRLRVRFLLAQLDATSPLDGDVLVLAAAASPRSEPEPTLEGHCIGRYRLQALLGRGGMSSVYRAVRSDDAYDAPVAFKLLSPALLGSDWSQRFQHETTLLARLRHPGIATLLDAGVADDGSPWLVTELVDGSSIERYCERHNPDLRARVALVLQLCEALAFVQRNLIVHRDIKCANVMVTEEGQVKLLDFGIARALGDQPDRTSATRVFTPDYAAPEQLRGEPATTATDVFGVGVVLYRLLTGSMPFASAGNRDHGTPTSPSRQVTGDPHLTLEERRLRARLIRGDLENITLRALAEHADARYPSAQALADDLGAWLEHRPVQARRPSWGYRLRLFVRRRTELALAITATVLAMTVGLAAALWQAAEARRQAEQALQAQARAGAVTTFLTELFEASDPDISGGRVADARELLAGGTARLRSSFADAPELRAELLYTLARIHRKIGAAETAAELRREAGNLVATDQPLALRLALEQVAASIDRQTFDHALAEIEQIEIDHADRLDTTTHIELDLLRAQVLARLDGGIEAALNLGRNLVRRVQEHAVDPTLTAQIYSTQLGQLAIHQHLEEARAVGEAALALIEAGHASPSNRIGIYNNLASVLRRLGDHQAAIERRRQALAIAREVYPAPHLQPAYLAGNLGGDLALVGRLTEALDLLNESAAMFVEVFPEPNSRTVAVDNNLGWVLMALERDEEALPYFERTIAVDGVRMGRDHANVRISRGNRARALSRLGRADEAEAEFLDILATSLKQFGDDHVVVRLDRAQLAEHDLRHGRPDRALHEIDLAIAGWRSDFPDGHPRLVSALGLRAQALAALGRDDEAAAGYREALAWAERSEHQLDHGFLDLLDHYSAYLAARQPAQLLEQLPALLNDPRLRDTSERPQWTRIRARLEAASARPV